METGSDAGRSKQLRPHSNLRLPIQYRDPAELLADKRNPRSHDKKQLKQIEKSICEFGFIMPVLVDDNSTIIAGHARVAAAMALHMDLIPVISVDHLDEHRRTAFLLADNQLALKASWNEQMLGEILQSLQSIELDFDIGVIGFDVPEIDQLIGQLDLDGNDAADEVPALQQVAVSRLGDLWILGQHKVFCGSSLEKVAYTALLDHDRASAVFTDPPYNVPIAGNVGGLGTTQHREFAMASGEMTQADFTKFLATYMGYAAAYSVDGSLHYTCMDWRHMPEMLAAGHAVYTDLKNLCVWAKTNAGMGSFYRSQHELVFVWKHGVAPHRNNVELGRHGRNRTNIWQYASPASFGRSGEEGSLLALHPTVKPVAMVADAILDSTARGDIVLDPFLGSGTTLMAAERVGRRCRGIELDPLYVDTIIRRWQAWTGTDAVLAATGATFTAVGADHEVYHV